MFLKAEVICWKCGKVIDVYTWPGHTMYSQECPVEGRPASVQFRRTGDMAKGTGYWLNRCVNCDANQGDFGLYMEPDGPFFGLEVVLSEG